MCQSICGSSIINCQFPRVRFISIPDLLTLNTHITKHIDVNNKYIRELSEVGINDIETVGGKNASLGEMIQNITSLGINIPNGFVITVAAYREFLQYNRLEIPSSKSSTL